MAKSTNRDGGRKRARGSSARTTSRPKARKKTPARPARPAVPEAPPPEIEVVVEPPPEQLPLPPVPLSAVETSFAARVPPPEPERPRPAGRRAIFLDVENTSKAQHLAHVIDHLGIDPWDRRTELIAVANWRVVGHDSARLLAQRGAHLVHSAPSTGVRDWSDLRIAVAAGIWLASARPGDLIEIVSDDRAFDAVGDVATSLGIAFRRLSYRRLKEDATEPPPAAERPEAAEPSGSRRRRRRRGRGPSVPHGTPGGHSPRYVEPRSILASAAATHGRSAVPRGRGPAPPPSRVPAEPPHTAPHDELVSVVRELIEASPRRSVVIDAVANALKGKGFQRPPGSPRLVTRLRRIKELVVSPSGTITLAEDGAAAPQREAGSDRELVTPREAPVDQERPIEPEPMDDLELELESDRQPAYLSRMDDEAELPEVDGNRKYPEVDGNRAPRPGQGPEGGQGRRRRRRRRRGGQRRPAAGPQPA